MRLFDKYLKVPRSHLKVQEDVCEYGRQSAGIANWPAFIWTFENPLKHLALHGWITLACEAVLIYTLEEFWIE